MDTIPNVATTTVTSADYWLRIARDLVYSEPERLFAYSQCVNHLVNALLAQPANIDAERQRLLNEVRHQVAEEAFANYDFGDCEVEASNGWEYEEPGRSMQRIVFLKNLTGDSIRAIYHVIFTDDESAHIADDYMDL